MTPKTKRVKAWAYKKDLENGHGIFYAFSALDRTPVLISFPTPKKKNK
jgi:hypothetical protein